MDTDTKSKYEEEAARLTDLLFRLVRLSGRSVRSIEHQLGVGSSALGKVLKGNIRLQVGHILMIADTLGLSPDQFFQLAYPKKALPHPLGAELMRVQGIKTADEQEIEAIVRKILAEIFGELIRPPEVQSAPQPPEPPKDGENG